MSTSDLAGRLRAVFVVELEEQAAVLSADLLALEADPRAPDRLKSVFRVAHTLKGAARAVGVAPIERVCHRIESMLGPVREGRTSLHSEHFAILFAAHDAFVNAVGLMRSGHEIPSDAFAGLERRLDAMTGRPGAAIHRVAAEPPEGERGEAVPAPRAVESGTAPVRIAPEKLDRMLAATEDLRMVIGRIDVQAGAVDGLAESTSQLADAWATTSRRLRASLTSSVDRASFDTLDALMRPVLGQVAGLARATAASRHDLQQSCTEVTERARRLRMRPFQEICEALPRVVRDIAAERKREVELRIVGGDVEADRAVLDALREPLVHLVRNAVDHGIEDPATRRASGKPATGTVTVRAEIRSQQLAVSVADDGAGIDTDALRTAMGTRAPDEDRDLAAAVFESGVTTRRYATAISGRGVGLDLVRTAVERVGGDVTLDWAKGRGASFVLHCPLTLAAIRVLLVGVGKHTFAVPVVNVVCVLRLRRELLQRAEGQTVMAIGGRTVRVVPLASVLGPPFVENALPEIIPAVQLEAAGHRLIIAVDALVDEREVTVRPIGQEREAAAVLSGASLLADHGVAPVVNAAALIAKAAGAQWDWRGAEPARGSTGTRPVILVADDSITTRMLEQSMLEAAGYDVIAAVDGRAAWQALEERGADLVVSDVEMPGMDGFALCRAIRSSPRFARLPVVLVTALERDAQRAEGMAAGADAYIGKSTFDQRTLLDVVRQFLG